MAGRQVNHQERTRAKMYDRTAEVPVQSRTLQKLEEKKEKERLTRKEASMAKAKAALEATYAKYGIKPITEKSREPLRPSTVMQAKRKQLTPEQAARLHRWLDKQYRDAHDRDSK